MALILEDNITSLKVVDPGKGIINGPLQKPINKG
jgi:hypothetical protein